MLSPVSASITVATAAPVGQPVPGHTRIAYDVVRTNTPLITTGDITDLEYIGNRVFVAGTSITSIQNRGTNTTSYNQPYLFSFNVDTGLVDANFRPNFGGGRVQEVEASPDGTKLFVVGTFNTVNGVTKRKIASINPVTGATVLGFTANANSQATSVEATNTTVYVGGQFTTVNGVPRGALAALNATTGAVVPSFVNNITGGIGTNGTLRVHAIVLTHDDSKLLVVHTGRQINGQDRYGVAPDRHRDQPAAPRGAPGCGTTTCSSSAACSASSPVRSHRTTRTSSCRAAPVATVRRSATRWSPTRSRAATSSSRCGSRACSTACTRSRSARSPCTSAVTSTTTNHRPRPTRGRVWTTSATAAVRDWPATASATTS